MLHTLKKALQMRTQMYCFPHKSISIFHMRYPYTHFPISVSLLKGILLEFTSIDWQVFSYDCVSSSSSFFVAKESLPFPSFSVQRLFYQVMVGEFSLSNFMVRDLFCSPTATAELDTWNYTGLEKTHSMFSSFSLMLCKLLISFHSTFTWWCSSSATAGQKIMCPSLSRRLDPF